MTGEKRYIAVDKDEVLRCAWCGTTESAHWIRGKQRGVYCSSTCETADRSICNSICGLFLLIAVLSGYLSSVGVSDNPITLFPIVLFGFLSLLIIWQYFIVSKARSKVPRDSRLHDELFDERYLRCENCGAPLDILDGAVSVKCTYCGYMNRVSYEV
jgi:LSD1 subclass zinc finger protein